jgi:hypothetical protein
MTRALFPLRIPSGWAVVFNIFADLSNDEITPGDVDSYLSDDILSIEQLKLAANGWETDPAGMVIDVAWTNPGNPHGEYVLSLIQGDWNGPKAQFRHHQGTRIAAAIEQVFAEVLAGRTVPEIADVFDRLMKGSSASS